MGRIGFAVVGVCVSVLMAVGVPAVAGAQGAASVPTASAPLHLSGAIIDYSRVSLTIQSGTNVQAVRLAASTSYILNRKTLASRPTFQYGEHARILALANPDGSLTAEKVFLGLLATDARGRIRGSVLDVSATSLTVKTKNLDVFVVKLAAKTRYYIATQHVSVRPDIAVGDRVGVSVRQRSDGTLAALSVNLYGDASGTTQISGRIIDFSPTSLTIRNSNGDIFAIGLTATTKYYVNGSVASTRPTFQYLENVVTTARINANRSMTAVSVRLSTT